METEGGGEGSGREGGGVLTWYFPDYEDAEKGIGREKGERRPF